MTAARSTLVQFQNGTNAFLTRQSWNLAHGIWTEDMLPPEQIGAGSAAQPLTVSWESESDGFMTGTEGSVTYLLQDGQTTLYVYWDNPFVGSNGYDIKLDGPLSSDYSVDHSGGSGDNATVTFSLKAAS
ncbi:aegerolysin family protein [Afifella marina]|uniref:Aegerolysin n=1 Tax=Afifella marina DSM 2698 TaxID=1120955 RepID=A0A1G5MW82_AFIMA|nr:aegerolysin family protein [Afifella marina]SCZ29366.1 Aegerolysin [Afifella marina DSM 2698]